MKNETGLPYFPRSASFAIDGIFVFAIDGIFHARDRRIFVMFTIDGILEFRDRRNFNVRDRRNRDRRNFYFRERRIKRSNQAIALGDRRIKRSIVSRTLKIRDREFSRNWNSGIPGNRSENKKKNPIPPSPQRGTK